MLNPLDLFDSIQNNTIVVYSPEVHYPIYRRHWKKFNGKTYTIEVAYNENGSKYLNGVFGIDSRYSLSRGWNEISSDLLNEIKQSI